MDPITDAMLLAAAKAIVGKVAADSCAPVIKGAKRLILGDAEEKAIARSLTHAYQTTAHDHHQLFANFDVNWSFLRMEAAGELSKVILTGQTCSPTRLAECCVDSLMPGLDYETRWDHVSALRVAFKALIYTFETALASEAVMDPAMRRVTAVRASQESSAISEMFGVSKHTSDDIEHYLHWLIERHRYVPTAGVVKNTTVQLPLKDVFVSLHGRRDTFPGDRGQVWFKREQQRLRHALDSGELDHVTYEAALDRAGVRLDERTSAETDDELSVLDAVRDAAHVLLLGDPGGGKTTLLRHLAFHHAEALINKEHGYDPVYGRPRLPFFVRIGDFARSPARANGLGQFLPNYLQGLECRTPGLKDLIEQNLEQGNCLFLLDGLDEVASAGERRSVVEATINFVSANSRSGNRFVITSRIAGYRAAPVPATFDAIRVDEMNDTTIERFLQLYCPALERAEAPRKSEEAVRAIANEQLASLSEALRENPGVRRLAANPLLLTALVLVHRARGRLPHRRIDAYVEVTGALGSTWRSVQGVPEADLPDDRMLTAWLTRLGAWMHQHRPEGSVSETELLQVLGPLWSKLDGSNWDESVVKQANPLDSAAGRGVLEFVNKIDIHTGLLTERAPRRYGFAHLTFEEYYAGRSLVFDGLADERVARIRSHLHDSRYDEPILLGLGLVGREQPEELQRLVDVAVYGASAGSSAHEDLLGRDFRFALRILADNMTLETSMVDALVTRAVDERLSLASRCKYSRFRAALDERIKALNGTRAGVRLLNVMDRIALERVKQSPERWCELASCVANFSALPPSIVESLELISRGEDTRVAAIAGGILLQIGVETEEAVERVVSNLVQGGDEDPWHRSALWTNKDIWTPGLIDRALALVQDIDTPATVFRRVCRGFIWDQSDETVARTVAALEPIAFDRDRHAKVRIEASLGLQSLGLPLAPAVIKSLSQDLDELNESSDVRMIALMLLEAGALTDDSILRASMALIEPSSEPRSEGREFGILTAVAHALPAAAERLLVAGLVDPFLPDETMAEIAQVLSRVGRLSPENQLVLVDALADPEVKPGRAILAGFVLGAIGKFSATASQRLLAMQAVTSDDNAKICSVALALRQTRSMESTAIEYLLTIRQGIPGGDRSLSAAIDALPSLDVVTDDLVESLLAALSSDVDYSLIFSLQDLFRRTEAISQNLEGHLVELLGASFKYAVRAAAITLIAKLPTIGEALENTLVMTFLDEDNDVRAAAGDGLVAAARRGEEVRIRIVNRLVTVCRDEEFDERDEWEDRAAWDYAYDALWALVSGPGQLA